MTTYYNAEFAAEHIVKRDPDGNWCKWNGSAYASLIESMDFTNSEYAIVELTDGTISSAGGLGGPGAMTVSFLDGNNEWDGALVDLQFIPVAYSVVSSSVIRNLGTGVDNTLYCYVEFKDQNNSYHEEVLSIKKTGTTTFELVNVFTGGSTDFEVYETALSPDGDLYIGGDFDNWGSSPNCDNIAMFSAQSSTLSALATGLNNTVRSMAFAPNGNLYIGGDFTNATTDGYGDYLCYWDGIKFNRVGTSELNGVVYSLAFDETGRLYAGGNFTDAGGVTGADYIARWNGSSWEPLGIGTNGIVRNIVVNSGKVYVSGDFTTAGGLTLTDRVAVWANGAWMPLDIDLPGTGVVYSILPASDGSLYITGAFSTTAAGENAVCGISYEVEVAEEIEEDFDAADLDPVDSTGV